MSTTRGSTRQSKGKGCRTEAETEIWPRTFWRFPHKHTLEQGKPVGNGLLVWIAVGSEALDPSGVLWYLAGNSKVGTQGGLEYKVLDSFVHMWKTWFTASPFLSLETRRQSIQIQKNNKIKLINWLVTGIDLHFSNLPVFLSVRHWTIHPASLVSHHGVHVWSPLEH